MVYFYGIKVERPEEINIPAMKKLVLITLLLGSLITNAQQTERYKKLFGQFIVCDTTTEAETYRNGKPLHVYNRISLLYNNMQFNSDGGDYTEYYRNGNVEFCGTNDPFGFSLYSEGYTPNGKVWMETITTEIDTDANTIEEFLEAPEEHIFMTQVYYFYNFIRKEKKFLRYKAVYRLNNTHIAATIYKYNRKGDLIKTKVKKWDLK